MATGRRNIAWTLRLVAGVLIAAFLAGSHGTGASESTLITWQWLPYDQGLPTYALAVTVAVQPTDPAVIYAGTYEPPGLWRSDDGGRSWAVDDGGLGGSPVYALHWDAVRGRWWAGARDGLYTRLSGTGSPGPCPTWQAAGLGERAIHAMAEDEQGRVYAATEDGLFGSSDTEIWTALPIADLPAQAAVLALAVSPDGNILAVGTAGQGFWISLDGGVAWTPAAGPATGASEALVHAYVSAVLVDPEPGGAVYAGTSEQAYRSGDGGATWQAVAGLEGRVHAFARGADGSLFAALTGKVARSTDGGRTWEAHAAGLRPGDRVLDLAVSPDSPEFIYAAAWDGVYASSDGGRTWDRSSEDLGYPDVNALAWDGQDNVLAGTRVGLYHRAGAQDAWLAVGCSAGRPVLTLADAGNGRDLYAGLQGGLARSSDGGRTWSEVPSELTAHGIAGVVADPADPDHLQAWVAFGRVHESRDGGRNWVARWEGLGDVRPVTAIHRTQAGQLYAGAEDGMFRWEPGGGTWQPVPLPLTAPTVFAVASGRHAPEVLYAGATDGLWRSRDGGRTWSRWGKGLEGTTVTALALSPADQRIAFAGTRHMGLYTTGDGGASWEPVRDDGLVAVSVRDILFGRDGRMVYVASDHGIWRGVTDGAW